MDFAPSFGRWLKQRRRELDLTQADLAQKAGYSVFAMRKIESGYNRPSRQMIEKLVTALDIPPESISEFMAFARGFEFPHPVCNLPVPSTPLLGRASDVAAIQRALKRDDMHLITLVGPPGVGKTRLALEVGVTLHSADASSLHTPAQPPVFADGVWLAELASLYDPSLVAGTIAAALHLPPSNRGAAELLSEYLRPKRLLLILDNCEHLIEACAELAATLLRACAGLRLLATSREGLNVAGETIWHVPSLRDEEAILLFAQRAHSVRPDFVITTRNRLAVATVCGRLDNIPLAIELAAARLSALSVEQIASRLDDRFRLLTGGSRIAEPHHRTLLATIDWSYDLLLEDERALLRRLSVFAGGWTLEAAETLWGKPDALDLLSQLVNKSLVGVGEAAGRPRYRLLETIRQYAHDRLTDAGELESALAAHLRYYTCLAHETAQHMAGAEQKDWLDVLESELDNLRVAVDWLARSGEPGSRVPFLEAITNYYYSRGYLREGLAWLDAILSNPHVDLYERAFGLFGKYVLAGRLGDWALARDCITESHAQALRVDDERLIVWTTSQLVQYSTNYEQGKADLEFARQWAWRVGDKDNAAVFIRDLGVLLRNNGDYEGAATVLTESLTIWRGMGNIIGIMEAQIELGILAFERGDFARARAALEEALAMAWQVGDRNGMARALTRLASVALSLGDYPQATTALAEAMGIYRWLGNTELMAHCLAVAARMAHLQGQTERAVCLLASTADAYAHKPTATYLRIPFYEEYDRQLGALQAEVDPAVFEKAWAEGQQMTPEQAAYALQGDEVEADSQDADRQRASLTGASLPQRHRVQEELSQIAGVRRAR